MATREEIREGINRIIAVSQSDGGFGYTKESDANFMRQYAYIAEEIVQYLHSQGAVIRVRCPDCSWYKFEDEVAGMTPCHSCNSTGYIVEPLIEDGKDNSGK